MRKDQPNQIGVSTRGGEIVVHAWSGSSPPVVLVHATGLHARCWDYVIRRLPDVRFLAIDVRGHGSSQNVNRSMLWDELGNDVIDVLDHFQVHAGYGVGHSMGGALIAHAAAERAGAFKRLVLLDPVIWPSSQQNPHAMNPGDHPVAGRRLKWESPKEMFERFKGKPPYSQWASEILHDYCQYGLVADDAGDAYKLACLPIREASVYTEACGPKAFEGVVNLSCDTTIIRARTRKEGEGALSFGSSPTWPDLATANLHCSDLELSDQTHFFPQEHPDSIVTIIGQMMSGAPIHWEDSDGMYG
ncbi:alpha/beta fold hydrolase [Pseudovibrio exalbescens]|uniref:alpha/beta fold hydrolase n=1 Tax=Pseudovibrio exalbescens TaxID=197461 RepID=UPI000C99BF25|nr:alpha/beta hydrolase [Pseudovibrio exalbescens]